MTQAPAASPSTATSEWKNAAAVGTLNPLNRILHALFASTMMRSGGFAIIDTEHSTSTTLFGAHGDHVQEGMLVPDERVRPLIPSLGRPRRSARRHVNARIW